MSENINRVVVVGGGTAGWLTATVIAAHHQSEGPNGLEVVLVDFAGNEVERARASYPYPAVEDVFSALDRNSSALPMSTNSGRKVSISEVS